MNTTDSSAFQTPSFNFRQNPPVLKEVLVNGMPIITIIVNIPAILTIIWVAIRRDNVKHFHLLSLGITDALVGVAGCLMAEAFVQGDRKFSFFDCMIRYYIFSVAFVTSLLHVLGICIQRVRIVACTVTIQQHQNKRRLVEWTVIAISWACSVVINTIPFRIWAVNYDLQACTIDAVVVNHQRSFSLYIGSVYGLIIMIVLVLMLILCRLLCVKRKKLPGNAWDNKDIKLCTTVAMLAILFLLTTTPLTLVMLSYDYLGEDKSIKRAICVLFSLLNSSINPFIYLYRIKEHREILKRIVRCGRYRTVSVGNRVDKYTTTPECSASDKPHNCQAYDKRHRANSNKTVNIKLQVESKV